jgi:hypothetical protein
VAYVTKRTTVALCVPAGLAPPHFFKEPYMPRSTIWTIVGVLLIIALVIFILSAI